MSTVGIDLSGWTSLLRTFAGHGIKRLVDVPLTPHGRQKGMSLFEKLRKAGIYYDHVAELGNPPETRSLFHAGELEKGRREYRKIISNGKTSQVDLVVGLARAQRTVIMCREHDAEDCHRWVIAQVARERNKKIKIEHL